MYYLLKCLLLRQYNNNLDCIVHNNKIIYINYSTKNFSLKKKMEDTYIRKLSQAFNMQCISHRKHTS